MNDEDGARLLAAVEALHEDVRALRREAREDREARKVLADRRAADAERQARFRDGRKADSNVTSRDSNVTSRDSNVTPQVVKARDLDQAKQKQDLKPAPSRDITLRNVTPRATGAAWSAYSESYRGRYGAEPVRNAKVNGQLAQLVKRLGDASADVARFYLSHNASRYTQAGHSVGMLLFDAEKLHTECMTGKKITNTAASQQDRTQANYDGWMALAPKEDKDGVV